MSEREYECPNCGFYVRVPEACVQTSCPDCLVGLKVDVDAELIDGSWKDRTALIVIQGGAE